MIKITVHFNDRQVDDILISGHAGYDKNGKDIVCAAVSSITITTVNAILRIDSEALDYVQNDDLFIKIKRHDQVVDILIENMLELFDELEKTYNKNIKINREVS